MNSLIDTTLPLSSDPPLIQGGLLNIFGYGVLVTGPSGVGKSELALALIDRGHKLVSDDVTLIQKDGPILMGRAPDELAGMIQLHGCGLFNVKELFGDTHYMRSSPIQMIIQLNPDIAYESNPLEIARNPAHIINIELSQLVIPCPTERNLALVIELLVRKEIAEK